MTSELTVLALAGLLQVVQLGLLSLGTAKDAGLSHNVGTRDTEPELSLLTQRLRRALNNHFEALILFGAAVLVVTLSGAAGGFTAFCAWVYLGARILYVPAYAFGWTPWRSLIFGVGTAATVAMLLAALLS